MLSNEDINYALKIYQNMIHECNNLGKIITFCAQHPMNTDECMFDFDYSAVMIDLSIKEIKNTLFPGGNNA